MRPHVLIAETTCYDYVQQIKALQWGRMFCFRRVTPFRYERWAFDNGAFKCWTSGQPFDEVGFLNRLDKAQRCGSDPYVAVTPDIVAGGLRSLEFSLDWILRLPRNWPWYLAVQDGMTVTDCNDVLHLFSGVFLGGTDKFKLQAQRWCDFAHANGKKFHYGRAGTLRKLRHAIKIGADSLDSSFPLWDKQRFLAFVAEYQDGRGNHEFQFNEFRAS